MKITEKINFGTLEMHKYGAITIVAFGDSVTHGAFAHGEIDFEHAYWNVLRKKLNQFRNYVPVNVINAGIGGTTAKESLERMEAQVLTHNPDLLIVCFGLNDINQPLQEYLDALEEIFDRGLKNGAEVIFMTPNMLNTSVADDTYEEYYEYAIKTAQMQNEGKMDLYMDSAVQVAKKMGVKVCDCYKKWKKLSETQDITYLLANRINHPNKEMHEMFAQSLFETIFENSDLEQKANDSTMYQGQ